MLLSTFYIMRPIYLQSFKLLHPTVQEMHLQETLHTEIRTHRQTLVRNIPFYSKEKAVITRTSNIRNV